MKLRKKAKKRLKVLLLITVILIIFIVSYKTLHKENDKPSSKIETLMKENNIDKKNYGKTLEYVLLNNIYDEKYLNEYADIKYNDQENFADIITTFLPKGYKGKEINYLFKLSSKNLKYLKNMDYQDISLYYDYSNFNVSNLERYNNYKKNNNIDIKDVITKVNLNLDLPVYTNTKKVENPNDILVLVNKYNYLPKGYKPEDLVYLDGAYGNQVPIREVLKEDFLLLQKAAKNEININIMPTTAFRSEAFQTTLYNNYVKSDGIEKADTYSARPSYSEHQTGLAIDLRNMALSKNIRFTDDDYNWLHDNVYKYGFIIRFPKEKEDITLYQFENWHIRYVGKKAAKIIYENNLTLEEYIDKYVTNY